jgi:hypothetical protein
MLHPILFYGKRIWQVDQSLAQHGGLCLDLTDKADQVDDSSASMPDSSSSRPACGPPGRHLIAERQITCNLLSNCQSDP